MALEKVKMQRRDAIALAAVIEQVSANVDGADYKLVYALGLSLSGLRAEKDAFEAAQKPAKEYLAFEDERVRMAADYAEKGENGEAKVRALEGRTVYVMDPERQAEFNQRLAELRETHKAVLDREQKRVEGFDDFLREEVEVSLQRFNVSLVPKKKVTALQMIVMQPLFLDAASVAGFSPDPVDDEAAQAAG